MQKLQRTVIGGREERSPGDRGWGVERRLIAEWASGGPESKHPVSVQRERGPTASPQTPFSGSSGDKRDRSLELGLLRDLEFSSSI